MSWFHRNCLTEIRALEGELRSMQRREVDHTLAVAALRSDRDLQEGARWDTAGDVEVLRDRVTVLEKELAERRHADSKPARRRARAAWRTLWDQRELDPLPVRDERVAVQAARAAAAQAILATPLTVFTGELTRRDGTYYLDGKPIYLPGTGDRCPAEAALMDRYGLTEQEISAAMDEDWERRSREAAAS
jgi:hypothetical protein